MRRRLAAGAIALTLCAGPTPVFAQRGAATTTANEIKLDETTTLKAAALEAQMSAVIANYALLQRQAQDLQQEMNRMLEERKTLIQEAARKASVEVKDPNEWAFDNKGQRYVHAARSPAPPAAPTPPR